MGAQRAVALCESFTGVLESQHGRFAAAEAHLRDAVTRYRQVGGSSGEALSLQRLGAVLTTLGRLEEARATLDEALAVSERAVMRSHCLTRTYATMARNRLAAGDLAGARAALEAGSVAAERHGHCLTCDALLLPEEVRVWVASGDVGRADARASELDAIAGRFESSAWRAMALQARARVRIARGDGRGARDALEQAMALFRALDAPYEVARCLALAGRADEASRVLTHLGLSAIEAEAPVRPG